LIGRYLTPLQKESFLTQDEVSQSTADAFILLSAGELQHRRIFHNRPDGEERVGGHRWRQTHTRKER